MAKIPTPMDRRRFMKHIGILGLAGVMGMSLGEIFSPKESELIEAASDVDIAQRRKMVWETKADAEAGVPYEDQIEPESGGFPYVNRRACAYHLPNPETGEYEPISRRNNNQFCRGPCVDVCPTDAIRLRKTSEGRTMSGFPQKNAGDLENDYGNPQDVTDCIGCQNCFKMCGYDAIQWVNSEKEK
jgi:Pyruvate/2-oxoacid:ferredoxin oxidoreductase delta subunit